MRVSLSSKIRIGISSIQYSSPAALSCQRLPCFPAMVILQHRFPFLSIVLRMIFKFILCFQNTFLLYIHIQKQPGICSRPFSLYLFMSHCFLGTAVTASAAASAAAAAGFPRLLIFHHLPDYQHYAGGNHQYEQNIYKTHSHVLLSLLSEHTIHQPGGKVNVFENHFHLVFLSTRKHVCITLVSMKTR